METKFKKAKSTKVGTIIFYSVYAVFVFAAIVGILYLLKELTLHLDNYERSLEKYEAKEVFESYFAPCNYDKMYDMQDIELSKFENKSHFISYMQKQYDGKDIIYKEVSAGLSNDKKYTVAADKVKFAEFTLKKSNTPKVPEDTWYLDSLSTLYQKNESVAVRIYSDSKVFVNDIELSENYITTDGITTESCKHVPEGVNGITLREYAVDGLLLKPNVNVINRYGNESTLVFDEKNNIYVEEITYDTPTEEITKLATDAAQTYAKYITLDATLYNLSKYFDTTSNTYYNIKVSEIKWYTAHIGYEFEDVELKEYYIYDENTFSIRYSCNHQVYRTKKEKHTFPLDLTLYFKNINGSYYIYDMVSNY